MKKLLWTILLGLCPGLVMAYSQSSQITASRSMSSYNVKYGDTVTATVTIYVGSITGTSLRGFYLTDYVPWAYPVIQDTVTINGMNINSRIKRESVSNQANYPGFGLQRWVLETPTGWTENNPINPMSTLIIKYKYVLPVDAPSTTISLPGFSWVAVDPTKGDAGDVFGYEDSPPSLKITGNPQTTRITIKAAAASSMENGSVGPSMAIDNDLTTRWSSAFTDNEWIAFDLGAPYIIKGVVLVWEAAAGKTYKIQGSNDAAFGGTPAELYNYTAAACGAKTDSLVITAGGSYRYVRMLGLTRCLAYGYSIYEARIYASSAVSVSAPPTVATPASATPNPVIAASTNLSVLGADDGGEPALTYTWAATGTPPAAVSFSVNGTNGAKNTVATFTKAGTYSLQTTIKDADNQTVTSSVSVTVNQTQTAVTVTPASATVAINSTQQFAANATDQFGAAMSVQPAFTWTVSGGGTISASGLFTAGATAGGPYTVTATAGAQSGTASITVTTPNSPPTVATAAAATPSPVTGTTTTLSVLGADDGGEAALTYTWATTGTPPAAVSFSANGTNAAKNTMATFTKAGSYALQVTMKDAQNATVNSSVTVTVNQTQTAVTVAPASATVSVNAAQQFTANANDQFGAAMSPQPTFTWTVSGGGTISASGLFTAGATAGGPFTVTATAGSQIASASVTVSATVVSTKLTIAAATASSVENAGTPASAAIDGNAGTRWSSGFTDNEWIMFDLGAGYNVLSVVFVWEAAAGREYRVQASNDPAFGGTPLELYHYTGTAGCGARTDSLSVNCGGTMYRYVRMLGVLRCTGWGYSIWEARIYGNTTPVGNNPPTVANAAAASPNPVSAPTTNLSVLGADDGGEAALTYTWATTGAPPAAVSFSANGTNAAKNAVATFAKAGGYTLQVTIKDAQNATVTSAVSVTVNQTQTSVSVSPASATVNVNATQQFTANANDQFGASMSPQPTVAWSVSGGGTISASGLFTAGAAGGGPYTVMATAGSQSATASVTVTAPNNPPTVATAAAALPNPVTGSTTSLSVLGADDGGEAALTYTWATTGTPPAAVSFSANGTNAAKNTVATFAKAGSYALQVTIKDAQNATVASAVSVTVNQTQTTVSVAPASATVNVNATQQFTANANDQFGASMSPQPTFTWTVSGGGTISAAGLFTAGAAAGGPYTVTATAGSQNATASVTVSAVSSSTKLTIASATASSVENAGTPASAAIDNNAGTRWSSAFSDPQWIVFDLGSPASVTKVVLVWEAASGKTYKIQGSNDAAFGTSTDLYSYTATNCAARTDSLVLTTVGTFRYVRMLGQTRCTGYGYSIWEARIYGSSAPLSAPPTVATAASASPNPATGTTASLSVLGADDGGEAALTYTWAATGTPPAAVTFSVNGTNAAKNTVATFTKAGSYTLQATMRDVDGQSVTSSVAVTVNQTQTNASVTPASATIAINTTQQFAAGAVDQFGAAMSPQPTFTWTVSGGGTISAAGLFTAGAAAGGPYTVTATAGSLNATASVTVTAVSSSTKLTIASANASSVENAGTPASAAIDNNAGTRWSSAFSDPQWITFDLGTPKNVTGVVLVWETASGKTYKVQASNDAAFGGTPLDLSSVTATNCAGRTDSLAVSSGGAYRYVRMLGATRCTGYGYSIWEARVYGY